jgi:hypothetical protein
MGTATMEVVPQWYRMEHKNGGFAGSYDWARKIIMFVHRGGTITYDLVEIENEMRRNQSATNS